jgi:hypothetical protein
MPRSRKRNQSRNSRPKRHSFHKRSKGFRKPKNILNINKHILNGVSFIVLGILLLRFSTYIFTQLIVWNEGIFWGYLVGIVLIIGGIFSLIAWWKNNVSMFTTKHSVKWN